MKMVETPQHYLDIQFNGRYAGICSPLEQSQVTFPYSIYHSAGQNTQTNFSQNNSQNSTATSITSELHSQFSPSTPSPYILSSFLSAQPFIFYPHSNTQVHLPPVPIRKSISLTSFSPFSKHAFSPLFTTLSEVQLLSLTRPQDFFTMLFHSPYFAFFVQKWSQQKIIQSQSPQFLTKSHQIPFCETNPQSTVSELQSQPKDSPTTARNNEHTLPTSQISPNV